MYVVVAEVFHPLVEVHVQDVRRLPLLMRAVERRAAVVSHDVEGAACCRQRGAEVKLHGLVRAARLVYGGKVMEEELGLSELLLRAADGVGHRGDCYTLNTSG